MQLNRLIEGGSVKKECYLWGLEGMTGRLGLGYEFFNAEKEEEIRFNKKDDQMQPPANRISDLDQMFENPQPLSFIN
jgi:hypothetical protein